MPISDTLKDHLTSAIADCETVDELDMLTDSLDEDACEALEDEIADRRNELYDSPTLANATRAELVAHLESNDELRTGVLNALTDREEPEQNESSDGENESSPEEGPSSGEQSGDENGQEDINDEEHSWSVGASEELDTRDSESWDGEAAYDEILDWAADEEGNVDQDQASRGFLVYDQNADGDAESDYKSPFARVVDGELKADSEGVKAADSRVDQMDVSDSVKSDAQDVVDNYKDKMGVGEEDGEDSEDSGNKIQITDNLQINTDDLNTDQVFKMLDDSVYNTLRDVAERLDCEISEDDDAKDLLAKLNEASADADVSAADLHALDQSEEDLSARDYAEAAWGLPL